LLSIKHRASEISALSSTNPSWCKSWEGNVWLTRGFHTGSGFKDDS
jgi:hypothetical protein